MSIFSALFGNGNTISTKIKRLDPSEYRKAIAGKGVQLIDVRTPREFASGHIHGARNLDVMNSRAFQTGIKGLKHDRPVYVYCRSGARSHRAARKLVKAGFELVLDLKGGYLAW